MEYPNSTLPKPHSLTTFFFNLSYLTPGVFEKIRPKRPTKYGRKDPGPKGPRQKRPRPKRPRTETTQGRNDSEPKRLGTGLTTYLGHSLYI